MQELVIGFGEFIKILDYDIIPLFLKNVYRHHGEFMWYLMMSKKMTFSGWSQCCFIYHKTDEGADFWTEHFAKYTSTTQSIT